MAAFAAPGATTIERYHFMSYAEVRMTVLIHLHPTAALPMRPSSHFQAAREPMDRTVSALLTLSKSGAILVLGRLYAPKLYRVGEVGAWPGP